jgi:amyloid beta A4 precursor protein-binding family B protein 1-interacting protein
MDEESSEKEEKIRIEIEKMKEESVKKMLIKELYEDGRKKRILVDEKMNCEYVKRIIDEKNNVNMEKKWGIVENMKDIYMERVYEENEMIVENIMMWNRD